jgi:hypothetical protein
MLPRQYFLLQWKSFLTPPLWQCVAITNVSIDLDKSSTGLRLLQVSKKISALSSAPEKFLHEKKIDVRGSQLQ